MTGRLVRRGLGALAALACLSALVSVEQPVALPEPELAPAADLSQFRAGDIISDAVFYDNAAMTAAQVSSFIAAKGKDCRPTNGAPCLKDYTQNTTTRAADSLCPGRYQGAAGESAAAIIKKVADACGINPRVLLVTLQKEMGFITSRGPTPKMYTRAMGYACPDNNGGVCDSTYNGFFNQLYSAAKQLKRYAAFPQNYGYRAGRVNRILYSPNAGCPAGDVYIENKATASLYNYTPYQPSKEALAAGYGVAKTNQNCSAYGNRNFYNYFTDWFGSTHGAGRDVDAPVGRLEAVVDRGDRVLVRGWTYDPNSPAAPMQVNVYAGGTMIGSATTSQARPDVAAANYGAGANQGFDAEFALAPGQHTVCAYPVNIGAGYSNPRLGCAVLTITTASDWNPKGRVADVRVAGTRLVVEGWAFDPDAPRWPTTVRVYAGSLRLGDMDADGDWPDVGKYYPHAGSAHGFRFETRLTQGTHNVCVYAFNKGTGTGNPRLGCRTVTITAPPLVAAITTGDPLGRLATVEQLSGQRARLTGWAFDPDVPRTPIKVHVYAGKKLVGETVAGGDWPDVARYFPYAGSAHGFSWTGVLPHGSYDLCAVAVNQGAGSNAFAGCQAVTVVGDPMSNPRGTLREVTISGGKVTVRGWSYDPDVPTEAVTVRLYAGSTRLADVVADGQWPDLAQWHPHAGTAHGYSWTGTLPPGENEVCVYAFNLAQGTTNPRIGCQAAAVAVSGGTGTPLPGNEPTDPAIPSDGSTEEPAEQPSEPTGDEPTGDEPTGDEPTGDGTTGESPTDDSEAGQRVSDPTANPRGRLAAVDVDGTEVRVRGWSFDPDVPTEPVTVRVYAGSQKLGDVVADEDWPDVGKYYPYAGSAHGFSFTGTLEPGTHLVCVYAFNQGNGTTNPRIGCQEVTVG